MIFYIVKNSEIIGVKPVNNYTKVIISKRLLYTHKKFASQEPSNQNMEWDSKVCCSEAPQILRKQWLFTFHSDWVY